MEHSKNYEGEHWPTILKKIKYQDLKSNEFHKNNWFYIYKMAQ